MKYKSLFVFLSILSASSLCYAQLNQEETFRTSSTTQHGRQFPKVNEEGRVKVSISAPDAGKVQLDLGGKKYDLVKDDKGFWSGVSDPQDEGFHYYQLNIDGASVPDPASLYFYGAGRWGSGIEIPAKDADFYALTNVPHGSVSENIYFSKLTGKWRRCFVYTPPDYHSSNQERYPVLYLQHGSFEDETGWASQGKSNLIIDNLIAAKESVPMIIVMDNGYAFKAPSPGSQNGNAPEVSIFDQVLVNEVIPMIDSKFRTIANRDNRAIAGLSMGANQCMRIIMKNLDKFSAIGGFSGTSNYPNASALDPASFLDGSFANGQSVNQKLKVLFLSLGTKEQTPFPGSVNAFRDMLNKQGINHVFYESPETAHEWQTWRRSLKEYAKLLFR